MFFIYIFKHILLTNLGMSVIQQQLIEERTDLNTNSAELIGVQSIIYTNSGEMHVHNELLSG